MVMLISVVFGFSFDSWVWEISLGVVVFGIRMVLMIMLVLCVNFMVLVVVV